MKDLFSTANADIIALQELFILRENFYKIVLLVHFIGIYRYFTNGIVILIHISVLRNYFMVMVLIKLISLSVCNDVLHSARTSALEIMEDCCSGRRRSPLSSES